MKGRMTVSLDQELIAAAEAAVAEGKAPTVSAWVADAMAAKAEKERRLAALGEFIEVWEAEFGEITEQDMREADRFYRERAIIVRDGKILRPPHPEAERA